MPVAASTCITRSGGTRVHFRCICAAVVSPPNWGTSSSCRNLSVVSGAAKAIRTVRARMEVTMFGLFKSKRQQRLDDNELECLKEVAQDYAEGKHGVTGDYAWQCYNDYRKLGAYKRNRTQA